MGFFKSEKKMVASADYHSPHIPGVIDHFYGIFSGSPVHIYVVLVKLSHHPDCTS